MKPDIRLSTGLIIRRDGEYLRGTQAGTGRLLWSTSPWDAWKTREREAAHLVAWKLGGEVMLFNGIVGQIMAARLNRMEAGGRSINLTGLTGRFLISLEDLDVKREGPWTEDETALDGFPEGDGEQDADEYAWMDGTEARYEQAAG